MVGNVKYPIQGWVENYLTAKLCCLGQKEQD